MQPSPLHRLTYLTTTFSEVGGYFDGRSFLFQPLETRSASPLEGDTVDPEEEDALPVYGRRERIQLSFATYNSDGHAHFLVFVQCAM